MSEAPRLPHPKDDMINPDVTIRYDAPATLRKWPSINGQRISPADGAAPYMVFEGNLGECIREFLTKPVSQHHLYEVATDPQPAFDRRIQAAPDITEIVARAEFR
jgi:hypothetical protein